MEAIEDGLTYKQAAQIVGVDETTFQRWKRKGKEAISGKYHQFYQAIKTANVKARYILLERIRQAGEGKQIIETTSEVLDAGGKVIRRIVVRKEHPPAWQALAWILERRFPDEFGRKAKPEPVEEHDPLQEWVDALVAAESIQQQ
ncbi:MAG: hypothetical protein ACOZF0_24075 [Thermodesulfobacteriota bacterium]